MKLAMDYAAQYGELHTSQKKFPGYSIKHYVPQIVALVRETEPRHLLDYGCGKGMQYLKARVHEAWGGLLPYCYDPGVNQLSDNPSSKFDGVICTDVLEHIQEDDVDAILADIFDHAVIERDDGKASFVFLAICCALSKQSKQLPDGRNVHLTVRPPSWWDEKIGRYRRAGLIVRVAYDEQERGKR